ncbi:MAG: DNA mismatch repair protein MutS [Spirochaetia bacterium]|nr:DNA mismatch repair protein MutS [Spirochaetia bacterium]
MPNKKKKKTSGVQKTAGDSRLDVPSDAYLPFKDIDSVVPQKLKVKQPKPVKETVVQRKEPIVLGFDPKANFGDILSTWEKTGELGGVTKRMKSHSAVKVQKSFGDILTEWEAEKGAEKLQKADPEIQKSKAYTPTKDFGSLLDQFEQTTPLKKKTPVDKLKVPDIKETTLTPSKQMEEAIMEKEELDQERDASVSWTFADTYRKWNAVSDEEAAIRKAQKEKLEKQQQKLSLGALRAMEPQATLDLHGMKVLEAEKACADFLRSAKVKRLYKIAIITGKGLHNDKGYSLLKEAALSQIRLSNVVSEAYTPKACHGGSGVIWIILKQA